MSGQAGIYDLYAVGRAGPRGAAAWEKRWGWGKEKRLISDF